VSRPLQRSWLLNGNELAFATAGNIEVVDLAEGRRETAACSSLADASLAARGATNERQTKRR
jgi:hypothetical protein